MLEADGDPDFMASLARGLAVMRCFADEQRPMTVAQASRMTNLSRSAVKRCLHTLVRLGYAEQNGVNYSLRPKVLSLSNAFLSSSTLTARAQPLLDELRDELHESCSLGVIEEDQVYYVARAEASRIMSIALRPGSRLPLYCTSMGRVLLADQDSGQQAAYLNRTGLVALTSNTCTNRVALLDLLQKVAENGYAIVDQELELGLRSIAVPVRNRGRTVAALNIGTLAVRASSADLRVRYLPALRQVARKLGALL